MMNRWALGATVSLSLLITILFLLFYSNSTAKGSASPESEIRSEFKIQSSSVKDTSLSLNPSVSSSATGSSSSSKLPHSSTSSVSKSFQELQKKYQLILIPTYDGSNQLTHPKILYFQNGWNGYKYWMVMTPYPYSNDDYENPSIVVSNDGIHWNPPNGLKNPVSGIPKDVGSGGHFSDPHLVMRGEQMELWYRYNPALKNNKKKKVADNSINIYYRKISKDGIHWTNAQKMMQSKDGHLSLCVNYQNGLYKIWYATYDGFLYHSESVDAQKWSSPVRCIVPLPKGYQPYHQDIVQNGSDFYLLQTAERKSTYTFQLFLLKSQDGIHFTNMAQIYPEGDRALWKNISFYRSTFFVKDNRLNLYISLIIPNWKWYITKYNVLLS